MLGLISRESRRKLWILPLLFLLWANCHGAFLYGWVPVGGYCVEDLYWQWRGEHGSEMARHRWTFWAAGLGAIVISNHQFAQVP